MLPDAWPALPGRFGTEPDAATLLLKLGPWGVRGLEYVHRPVMLAEVIEYLLVRPGGTYLDCTVGGGGHAREIARHAGPTGTVIGIDRDPEAVEAARRTLDAFGERVRLVQADYRNLGEVLEEMGVEQVDGVLFDLGVSSHQLDSPERGFGFRQSGPLDMRMDPRQELTARDLVNGLPREELARIICEYGEERWAGRIATAICRRRPLETTEDLVQAILAAVPARSRSGGHPARRTFQALRIAVNRELEGLAGAIRSAVEVTRPGGRVLVITFHSLEDRLVKRVFRELAQDCRCPPRAPVCTCGGRQARVRLVARLSPSAAERRENPRCRSARLRAVERSVLSSREDE